MTVSSQLREDLESALIARLPMLLREVSGGLAEYWPDYADFLDSDTDGIGEAAALFVRRLVAMADPPEPHPVPAVDPSRPGTETVHLVFEQIGRQQMQEGIELTRLLTAFQLGARVAWRHVSETALDLGMPTTALASLADSVFVFVNQLSFAAARGYLQAQVDDARLRERHREELAELLLSGRAAQPAIRAAAARAGWTVPDRAAVVLVDPEDDAARQVVDHLGARCLPVRRGALYGAIVPDPGTLRGREELVVMLRGAGAVVGHAVPPDRLPRTSEVARVLAELRRTEQVTGDPVFADDHLDTIIVARDPGLLDALREQVLAPLADLPDGARERLTETLASWLRHLGDRHAMAEDLSIHPQTVRYRMAQLHERYGDRLDSPRERARLFLALTWAGPRHD